MAPVKLSSVALWHAMIALRPQRSNAWALALRTGLIYDHVRGVSVWSTAGLEETAAAISALYHIHAPKQEP